MNKIHSLAVVSPSAKLGEGVEVGPFAFIDDNVEIGDGCKILPHATIFSYVKMGRDCTVFPGAVVGAIPQDLKFEGEITRVEIGDRVTIRECATINRGTKASGKFVTKVGSDTLVMSYVHIAHDCCIGSHCILVSHVALAGETDIEDWAILGGGSMAHQFTHIGQHAMVGAGFKLVKDVPPYVLAGREPVCFEGVNRVGLSRRGFTEEKINEIKDIYETLYFKGMNVSDALAYIEQNFPKTEERDNIIAFIRGSKRGAINKPRPSRG